MSYLTNRIIGLASAAILTCVATFGFDAALALDIADLSNQEASAGLKAAVVKQATEKVGLAQKYNEYAGQGVKLGLVKGDAASVEQYVTQKALDGLYAMIAEEDSAIRKDPIGAGSAILGKVFGALKWRSAPLRRRRNDFFDCGFRREYLALDREIENRDAPLHRFHECARRIARFEREIGVRLSGCVVNLHAGFLGDPHHRPVLRQTMHEQRFDAEVARVRSSAQEKRGTQALTPCHGVYRQAEFSGGMASFAR